MAVELIDTVTDQKSLKRLALCALNTQFTGGVYHKKYHLVTQYQKFNDHILRNIVKWASRTDIQIMSALFTFIDPITVFSSLPKSRNTGDWNGTHGSSAI